MGAGNDGGGVHDVVPDIGSDGVSVHGIVTNSGGGCSSVCHKFLLGAES